MKGASAEHPTVTFVPTRSRLVGAHCFTLRSASPFPTNPSVKKVQVQLKVPYRASPEKPATLTLYYYVPRWANDTHIGDWLRRATEQLEEDYVWAAKRIADEQEGERLDAYGSFVVETSRGDAR